MFNILLNKCLFTCLWFGSVSPLFTCLWVGSVSPLFTCLWFGSVSPLFCRNGGREERSEGARLPQATGLLQGELRHRVPGNGYWLSCGGLLWFKHGRYKHLLLLLLLLFHHFHRFSMCTWLVFYVALHSDQH